jgi:PAS domain S-box-containing protein
MELINELRSYQSELVMQKEELQTILDPYRSFIFYKDKENRFLRVNKAYLDVLGVSKDKLVGMSIFDIFPKEQAEAYWNDDKEVILSAKPKLNIVEPMKFKSGINYVQTDKIPYRDVNGNIIGIIGFAVDITRRKQAEEELERIMEDLKRSNKELEQFAYITSHDLREPLRMITGFLQLLERRYHDKLDEDANEFIGFAVDGAKRLDAMINDILIFSRVSNKERNLIPVNFNKVIEKTYLNLKISIEETNAEITNDPLPTFITDEKLMIQLFQNIISNAIKYHSEKTPKIHIN